jgi:hypothetical protein
LPLLLWRMIEEFIFGVIELDNDLAINAASADARA